MVGEHETRQIHWINQSVSRYLTVCVSELIKWARKSEGEREWEAVGREAVGQSIVHMMAKKDVVTERRHLIIHFGDNWARIKLINFSTPPASYQYRPRFYHPGFSPKRCTDFLHFKLVLNHRFSKQKVFVGNLLKMIRICKIIPNYQLPPLRWLLLTSFEWCIPHITV